MPGRRQPPAAVDTTLCRRCQANAPTITVRTEPLCSACFAKYVSTKIIKRMESFRVRHAEAGKERLLLLPLSLGPCSMVLLHILSQHLSVQAEKSGRTGYRLLALFIDDGAREGSAALFERVKERYPMHTYFNLPLSDALSLEGVPELLSPLNQATPPNNPPSTTTDPLSTLLSTLPSATSRADLLHILLRKLVVHAAQHHACEAVLWADSTTRLAERTLAETAKGRGFTLPSSIGDGEAPHGLPFYYPMRDLLRKEIISFTSLVEPGLDEMILRDVPKAAVSTKNTTIDDLMKQYFASVEREFPSIVANVVRTTGKLKVPALREEVEEHCELCDAPLRGHAPERSRLCYGCIRILRQAPAG
ncbi:hypothetical protein B0A55_07836 [Friedmanniomyces simplex]|uniref:Cytoplasmic tRNA 2-thiolation protein 2 n=1 Tax=Friedmanniomyces simplex TaxID=329884 RepID=A0A4U0X364_9PEZI|nr:hypothetical protein B0A55_07836 [Friedmanniomyces simplex]